MTLAEIKTRVWDRLDEGASTSVRYPTATLGDYCAQGQRFYIARTGCQNATETITQDAYTLIYNLPCDLIQIERVLWLSGGVYYPLAATHPRELDASVYWWERMTDTRARAYFALGLNRIGLWPYSSTGGEDYIVHYQQDVPDTLTAVPVEDHTCLVNYVVARCLLSEGKVEDGAKEMMEYRKVVDAAARRMQSVDRVWSMVRG